MMNYTKVSYTHRNHKAKNILRKKISYSYDLNKFLFIIHNKTFLDFWSHKWLLPIKETPISVDNFYTYNQTIASANRTHSTVTYTLNNILFIGLY